MSGAAFLRLKKLKGSGIVSKAARHNRRAIQAELGARGPIDPARSHLNETLRGPPSAADVANLAKARMTAAGITTLRKDAVLAIEFVFSLPALASLDQRSYFEACTQWAADRFGGADNILTADIHRDEAAPHCHVLLLPMLDGKMVGSDLVGNPQKLKATQADFHAKVASLFGLKRAPERLAGRSKAEAAARVLEALRTASDPALNSLAWPLLRDAIEQDPAPYLLALGIDLRPTQRKLRSMTAIFTSTGKGPKREPNPIGFKTATNKRTLCSVGFTPERPRNDEARKAAHGRPQPCPIGNQEDSGKGADAADDLNPDLLTRERDSDRAASDFDHETGEFRQATPKRDSHERKTARAMVAAMLNGQKQRPG